MFDFLNFFSSSASIFATGASLFNTYANLQAGQEQSKAALHERQFMLQQQSEDIRFDKQRLRESLAEYSAISNYQVDMLRQDQLYRRQQLGYNILSSGVGITPTDSAGLLLRHQAYMDEMQARSAEAQANYNRPRSNMNYKALQGRAEHIKGDMRNIRSAQGWQQAGSLVSGLRDLASIARMGE